VVEEASRRLIARAGFEAARAAATSAAEGELEELAPDARSAPLGLHVQLLERGALAAEAELTYIAHGDHPHRLAEMVGDVEIVRQIGHRAAKQPE
jgi:hypothetical protein